MKLYTLILFFVLPVFGWSQYNVTGKITDQATKEVLSGVTVFVNNSSYATLTDTSGNFTFTNLPVSVFDLIAVKPGFSTGVYRTNFKTPNLKITFQLNKEEGELEAVNNDSLSRGIKKWSELFMAAFIGTSANSYDCYIANPKALRFKFIDSLSALSVAASEPLQIFNEALGYIVYYYPNDLFIRNSEIIYNNSFFYFKELKSKQPLVLAKWKANRNAAYTGSLMHFVRSLYIDKLKEEGFEVKRINRLYEDDPDYNKARKLPGNTPGKALVTDSLGNKSVLSFVEFVEKKIAPVNQFIRVADNGTWLVPGSYALEVRFIKSSHPVSSYIRINGSVLVENNGLYFDPSNLIYDGYWKSLKLADELPCNYKEQDGL